MNLKESVMVFSFPQETQQIPTEDVALDISLPNGQKVTVNILTSDQTEDVLDVSARVCKLVIYFDYIGHFKIKQVVSSQTLK